MTSLDALAREAATCTLCALADGRTQVVFGMGNPQADLMFIGEGPGAEEDKQGLPFVGRSGKLLDQLILEEMGLTRDDCYIANTTKCLRYNALVQLGDGSWERIGRLVRSQYEGSVMSVDADGSLVPRRVTGWHASPLAGRRVFKLTYRSAKRAGAGQVNVQLTGDHEVLTQRGWRAVQDLEASDRIATGQGLNELVYDVVCGSLLGDSHLDAKASHLSFSHSGDQAAYALFKADLLLELMPRLNEQLVAAVSGGEKMYPTVSVHTRAHRALRTLRRDFYNNGEKVVPDWIAEQLNARMLAFWFMDDGHTRIRAGKKPLAEIATCGFSEADLSVLVAGLAGLGLPATVARGRVYFNVPTTRRLSMMIAPFVSRSMRYKLHPDVEKAIPFDPGFFVPGPPRVMYDEAEVTEVTDEPRTDASFYCIDVEETNNFVTAGGVVHNCRPPGNRDPRPEELEACRPWLERQIELIKPRVIVTLGNFATKWILQTSEGITRLRGKTYPWREGIVVVPTYHPAAVLRGGGATMAQMRADLVRAKLALRGKTVPA